jgi:hypothetical protein
MDMVGNGLLCGNPLVFVLGEFAVVRVFPLVRQSSGNVTASLSVSLGTQSVCDFFRGQCGNLSKLQIVKYFVKLCIDMLRFV